MKLITNFGCKKPKVVKPKTPPSGCCKGRGNQITLLPVWIEKSHLEQYKKAA